MVTRDGELRGDQEPRAGLEAELAAMHSQMAHLRSENARLLRLLDLTPAQARPPGPVHTGDLRRCTRLSARRFVAGNEGRVLRRSVRRPFRYLCSALENRRSGKAGWMPAVRGGWRRGAPAAQRDYLPLTEEVLTARLSGELDLGLYPLLNGDRCWWLAADFDGPAATLDALAYLKAARAVGAPVALEVPRSGIGAHAWLSFTAPVPAAVARQIGTGPDARGDRSAGPDDPGKLRPAVSLPGRPSGRVASEI